MGCSGWLAILYLFIIFSLSNRWILVVSVLGLSHYSGCLGGRCIGGGLFFTFY